MGRFKEVLIFVAGAAPQIITETIYSLSQKKPPIYADELYIITTSLGKKIIKEVLLDKNVLSLLYQEYSLPPISFTEKNFIVPRDKQGQEISDIRSKEDNEIIGDLITSFIREKAKDEGTRLHCSLAGGRKTMSFYLGSALQLFGRPWDRLYHVLVTPEFEANPEFFYKPKKNKTIWIKDKEGRSLRLNTKDAQIYLAELPFIRLFQKLRLQAISFSQLVSEGQKEIDLASIQPELRVNIRERLVSIGNRSIYFQPMLLFIYMAFINQKIKKCFHPDRAYCFECRDCFEELNAIFNRENLEKLAHYYSDLYKGSPLKAQEFLSKWKSGLDAENVRQYISKLKGIIQKELQDELLCSLYSIQPIRIYAGSRYGLRVEKSKIILE